MTPTELRALLASAGLSQRGAARALEVDERTMRRWCANSAPIPRVTEYAVRWLAARKAGKR